MAHWVSQLRSFPLPLFSVDLLYQPVCEYNTQLDIGLPHNHTQREQIGSQTSSTLELNTGAPQGCLLSPLQFTLYTHECTSDSQQNSIVKYADDTTIIDHTTNNDDDA